MIYNEFKGKKLSALGFGTMRLPILDKDISQIDDEKVFEIFDYAISKGVNYFDTAWGYHNGMSEISVGKALKRHPRNSFYLASKFPGYDVNNFGKHEEIFERQLEKCQVEYFDFYLIHNVCEQNIEKYLDPISEYDRQVPINPYGESKLCFEKVLKWYHEIHGLNYAALRYFNAAGATELHGEDHRPESHLIPIILQTAAGKRGSLKLFGDDYDTPDGSCIRDYIHVWDLAQAHELALHAKESGHYNLGTGNGLSVFEIIKAAEAVTGIKIPFEIAPRRLGDPARLIACSDRARKELKWTPQFESAEKIVESAWLWRQKFPEGYAD